MADKAYCLKCRKMVAMNKSKCKKLPNGAKMCMGRGSSCHHKVSCITK